MLSVCLTLSYILVAAPMHIQPEPGLQFMIDKMLSVCLTLSINHTWRQIQGFGLRQILATAQPAVQICEWWTLHPLIPYEVHTLFYSLHLQHPTLDLPSTFPSNISPTWWEDWYTISVKCSSSICYVGAIFLTIRSCSLRVRITPPIPLIWPSMRIYQNSALIVSQSPPINMKNKIQ
jgi:hypothetical protein